MRVVSQRLGQTTDQIEQTVATIIFGLLGAPPVEDEDLCTAASEREGARSANATRRARDEGGLSGKIAHRKHSFCRNRSKAGRPRPCVFQREVYAFWPSGWSAEGRSICWPLVD
jgi:hypothetical protein